MKLQKINIATGFVKPKTTSLFFDKIWLPEDDLIDYQEDIPSNILFKIEATKHNKSSLFYKHISSNSSIEHREFLRYLKNEKFSHMVMQNRPVAISKKFDLSTEKIKYSTIEFESSKNRNKGIREFTKSAKVDYGIDIIPIYIDSSSFEKDFNLVPKKTIYATSHPLAIAMEFIPEIIEEKLEWSQVLDIRKDRKSIKRLQKFRTWINSDLLSCKREEIEAKYIIALEEYKLALKKHGIMTTIGTFSTILDVTATILENWDSSIPTSIGAGITIATGLSIFTLNQCYSYYENKNKPIAYIYNLIKQNQ